MIMYGKYSDWIGISLATLSEYTEKVNRVVMPFKKQVKTEKIQFETKFFLT